MSAARWLVACLCAEWCGTCREFRPAFERQREAAGTDAHFAWVDIEEHPDVMDDLDIETFPTLLVARGADVVFFGPSAPHESTLARLVRAAFAGELDPVDDADAVAIAERIRALAPAAR